MISLILMGELAKTKRKNDKTQIGCLGLIDIISAQGLRKPVQNNFHIEAADYSSLYGSDSICATTNRDFHV